MQFCFDKKGVERCHIFRSREKKLSKFDATVISWIHSWWNGEVYQVLALKSWMHPSSGRPFDSYTFPNHISLRFSHSFFLWLARHSLCIFSSRLLVALSRRYEHGWDIMKFHWSLTLKRIIVTITRYSKKIETEKKKFSNRKRKYILYFCSPHKCIVKMLIEVTFDLLTNVK